MYQFWYLLFVPVAGLSIVAGLAAYPPLAMAPTIETPYLKPPQLPTVESIEELYQIRDRLRTELKQPGATLKATPTKFAIPTALLQMLHAVEIQIRVEETAKERWAEAIQLAVQARELENTTNPSFELLDRIPSVWQQAISSLQTVPEGSLLTESATQKVKEYETYLAIASNKLKINGAGFLKPIVERTGLPPTSVRITVCHVSRECRHWYGDRSPASSASLIKVPIAIALMQKVNKENISLETKIRVSRSNYTEDASDIWTGREYTLRQMLMRMINQSSNIATNQLLDYLGRDYVNRVLRDRGYEVTQVNSKLVGESTYPANVGSGSNHITTDELTQMMLQIYNLKHAGDEVLRDALASQYDQELGYDGLKNSSAIWIGEKTGRNSKVLGTTLAMSVNDEDYVLSVAFNYSSNERAIRRCIKDIATYIDDQGHL